MKFALLLRGIVVVEVTSWECVAWLMVSDTDLGHAGSASLLSITNPFIRWLFKSLMQLITEPQRRCFARAHSKLSSCIHKKFLWGSRYQDGASPWNNVMMSVAPFVAFRTAILINVPVSGVRVALRIPPWLCYCYLLLFLFSLLCLTEHHPLSILTLLLWLVSSQEIQPSSWESHLQKPRKSTLRALA